MSIALIIATSVEALRATTFVVAPLASPLVAVVTTFLAPAVAPDRVSHNVQNLLGCIWVVARYDQLTTSRTLFGSFVPNQDAQTRTGVQSRREWVVDQLPVLALPLERNARNV